MIPYLETEILLYIAQVPLREQVLALLADYGFDGFLGEGGKILFYLPEKDFSERDFLFFLSRTGLNEKIDSFQVKRFPYQNWNALWEKNYPPVLIGERCPVRAPAHPSSAGVEPELVINPGMSFGTARHETTRMLLEWMLEMDWNGKKVLDLGCGTGILATLADRPGAKRNYAIEKDALACENAVKNAKMNGCRNARVQLGQFGSLAEDSFDAVLANISLNVLMLGMGRIASRIKQGGLAMLSGYCRDDLDTLVRPPKTPCWS